MAADLNPEKNRGIQAKTLLDERHVLRRTLIERRQALSSADCAHLSARLRNNLQEGFPQLAGMCVAFCWPVQNEADLRPLLETWLSAKNPGFCALLPVVVEKNTALAFRRWTPETELVADRYGIPTPAAGDFVQPEALLLPLNAFDAAGYRLGYGGGYFDRTLAVLGEQGVRPLAIGVGFEIARVDTTHPEAHDQRLDAVVTEAGVFRQKA